MVRTTVIALLLLPAVASAQSTNCQWIGQVWTCNTPRQGSGIDFGLIDNGPDSSSVMADIVAARRAREQADLAARAQQQSEAPQQLRAAVGQLVAEGRCPDAQRLAVANGDFVLAEQVRAYCAK